MKALLPLQWWKSHWAVLLFAALALLTLVFSYAEQSHSFWSGFLSNISAGFFGTSATLFFIDRTLENRREQERRRIAKLAHAKIRGSLSRIVLLLTQMIKAASPRQFLTRPASLEELFNSENTEHLDWLNPHIPAGRKEFKTWAAQWEQIVSEETESLSKILDRYVPYLEVEFFEALERLTWDTFLRVIKELRKQSDYLRDANCPYQLTLNGTKGIRNNCFGRIIKISELLKKYNGSPLSVPDCLVRLEMWPDAGSGRLKERERTLLFFGESDPPVMPIGAPKITPTSKDCSLGDPSGGKN